MRPPDMKMTVEVDDAAMDYFRAVNQQIRYLKKAQNLVCFLLVLMGISQAGMILFVAMVVAQ